MPDHRRVRTTAAHVLIAAAALALTTASCAPSGSPAPTPPSPAPPTAGPTCRASGRCATRRPPTCRTTRRAHGMRAGPQRRRGRRRSRISRGPRRRRPRTSANRATADPLAKCYMPGVPRIMYMEFPFHIFQTRDHVAHHLRVVAGVPADLHERRRSRTTGIDFWMGDSRGRWEGDTLVVDVTNHNDKTWFDTAGNFHSEALHVVERYTMTDADTHPVRGHDRGSEGLHAAVEDRDAAPPAQGHGPHPRVSVPGRGRGSATATSSAIRAPGTRARRRRRPRTAAERALVERASATTQARAPAQPANRVRSGACPTASPTSPGFLPDGGGANYGLEKHPQDFLTPAGRGVVVDPPDGKLPMQPWARGRAEEPDAARARLRRPDGALLRRRRAAVDVHAVAVSHPAAARLRRHPPRAHVVAQSSRSTAARTSPTPSGCGRATRWAAGRATRWSSRPGT